MLDLTSPFSGPMVEFKPSHQWNIQGTKLKIEEFLL